VTRVSFAAALAAGIGAGAAAGLVNVGVVVMLHARLPPLMATAGSSVFAGALGGLVYWAATRITVRPVPALWVTSLLAATADTIIVFTLPFPTAERDVHIAPLAGIVTPLLQILALVGVGGSSPGHLPANTQPAYLAVHYATAIIVSLLVPAFARMKSG
jgi:hypothetical protein